jgi:hypothetical protein
MRLETAAAVALLCLPAGRLAAQAPRIGGQLSFAQDVNAGVGLRLEDPLTPPGSTDLRVMAAFDYYFPNSPFQYRELNGDIAWGFRLAPARMSMYVGGGINIARSGIRGVPDAARTDLGVNLVAGFRFLTGARATPYVELRPELGGGNRLVVSTGVMF